MSQNFYHITDDLLVKYLLGEATPEERQLVDEWLASDTAHKKQYDDFKTIWEESKQMASASKVDEDEAWQRFKNRLNQKPGHEAVVRKMNGLRWMRVAALFILVAGAAWLGYQMFSGTPVENLVVASQQKAVIDTLPDGSVVTLNKNSVINYPSKFKGETRAVVLKGEGFFNITPDKERPFIINVNGVTIKVVGTSFNVRNSGGITEVIVETGIVQVTHKNKTVELKPTEKVKVTEWDSVLVKEKEEDKLYNYYRTREFVCDDTPLWKLVEVLNEAYDANVVIENNDLRNLKLNTTFVNESLNKVLEVASLTFGFSVINEKDRIVLK